MTASQAQSYVIKKKHTKEDQQCLQSCFSLAETIADLIGPHCEVLIHSLENIDKSVVKIINGHHTGRILHSPVTDLGLKMLRLYEQTGKDSSNNYFTYDKNGGLMKSTTCILKNYNNEVIGMLCININLSVPFPEIIQTLIPNVTEATVVPHNRLENFSANAKEIIENAIMHAVQDVDTERINTKLRNKSIIRKLYDNGIFELKDAVVMIAEYLEITRHAVYKNIREFKSEDLQNS